MSTDQFWPRVASSLHALDTPPQGHGWNRLELHDLLREEVCRVEAAVLVGLVERANDIHVLLTLRTQHLSQHAGQISFPGGRIELDDNGPSAAALRETFEEVGIDGNWVEPLGFLDPLETISNFRVTPMVARLRPGFVVRADQNEVAEVFEAPLSLFFDEAQLHVREVEYRGRLRSIHEFHFEGRRIWGATAAMLLNLKTRMGAIT